VVTLILADSRIDLHCNNQGQRAFDAADEFITDEAAYHGKRNCWKGFRIQELITTKMKAQGISVAENEAIHLNFEEIYSKSAK